MGDTGIFAWLDRAESCGDRDVERAAMVMKDYYQGVGAEPEYAEQSLASRPAEVDDEGLPALPEPMAAFTSTGRAVKWHSNYATPPWSNDGYAPLYTAEQYRQGQRDAVAADRARREAVEEPFYPQLFLNWNRSQECPPVAIGKEMGVARKAVELSRVAPSHATNKEK